MLGAAWLFLFVIILSVNWLAISTFAKWWLVIHSNFFVIRGMIYRLMILLSWSTFISLRLLLSIAAIPHMLIFYSTLWILHTHTSWRMHSVRACCLLVILMHVWVLRSALPSNRQLWDNDRRVTLLWIHVARLCRNSFSRTICYYTRGILVVMILLIPLPQDRV
jgi:hypothetical protein